MALSESGLADISDDFDDVWERCVKCMKRKEDVCERSIQLTPLYNLCVDCMIYIRRLPNEDKATYARVLPFKVNDKRWDTTGIWKGVNGQWLEK